MNEIRDIPGYERLYAITEEGRVFSYPKGNNNMGKFLKHKKTSGYYSYSLRINGTTKDERLHRLIALTFIPNPDSKPCINHIDGNKLNNSIENLEWCTHKHNMMEASRIGLLRPSSKGKFGKDSHRGKSVLQYSLDGNIIGEFSTAREASKSVGINHCGVSSCCTNQQHTAGGFIWRYK